MLIRKAAVIGAGTMGAGIATHLANAGVRCLLLDVVPAGETSGDRRARSRLASDALERAASARPPMLMDARDRPLVEPGNVEDDLDRIADCDWIIEAVTEDLEVKRSLYARIARHRRRGSVVSSNTSGLALRLLTDGLDEEFQEHFLITHFFNPPRYMYLVELVRGPRTRPEVFDAVRAFTELRLGKGTVECKDTPNFIANRIGVFSLGISCRYLEESGLSVEEVDALTGTLIGRPKTATFRLFDLVGIDVALLVMKNAEKLVRDDESRELFVPPPLLERMVREGRIGRKAGAGFYKKSGDEILVLDLESWEYRPQKDVAFPSADAARKEKTLAGKIRALTAGEDAGSRYVWRLLSETLLYSARRVPEISDEVFPVDRAMRWGFNWELGPFELWDAIGVREMVARLEKEGREVPPLVESLLASGAQSFYAREGSGIDRRRVCFRPSRARYEPVPERPGILLLEEVRDRVEPIRSNAGASLLDLGDGVLCVEFHSKLNTISGETLDSILEACDLVEEGGFQGLVIGNQAENFSAGANLVDVARAARERRWQAIDEMIRKFHRVALRIRYLEKPVIAAVRGMALGGGCEIPLACDGIQAAAETYMGLVELGVGLIPAGGGTREMACRAAEAIPPGAQIELFGFVKAYFETIALARTSTSAAEAMGMGFLRPHDGISMDRDRTIADAKRRVLSLAAEGYRPPRRRTAVAVLGEPGLVELEVWLHQYVSGGFISEYDAFLGRKLAYVICGGAIDAEFTVSEEYLLDLEREVFLSLLGQEKTLERIAHTLKTGKPLRN